MKKVEQDANKFISLTSPVKPILMGNKLKTKIGNLVGRSSYDMN